MGIKLYEAGERGTTKCLLCPHFCDIGLNKKGLCKNRKNIDNKIQYLYFDRIFAMAVEPIEKKPFKGFLKGSKTLSIGIGRNCNLKCNFCENFEISQEDDFKFLSISKDDIINTAKDHGCESICATYNEPTISYEFLIGLAEKCHQNGLKFILKTNAYINKEPWINICKNVDAINIDYKGSKEYYKSVCGVKDYIVLNRIKEALNSDCHLEISIPVYREDDKSYLEEFKEEILSIDNSILVHLLKIHPSYKITDKNVTTDSDVQEAKDILND